MFRFVILSAFAALAMGQNYHQNPQTAAIISEQRYLSGDGKFGAAYTQEDGINFKEETDADGTRHGSYSYIDPSGQRKTISYTAGKNGFQASGDHLPVAPAAPPQVAPTSGYQPIPRYQPPAGPQQPAQTYNSDGQYDEGQYDPRYNDPNFSGNQLPSSHHVPQQQHQQQQHYQPAPVAPQYQHQPQQPAGFNQNFQHHQAPAAPHYHTTTPNPHRFQPPVGNQEIVINF